MRKLIVFLTFITGLVNTYGQSLDFAIISDKDGFATVRNSKEVNDVNIIDKLENGFVVNYFEREGFWIAIGYEKNEIQFSGFIFRDRLKEFYDFPEVQGRNQPAQEFKIFNKNIEIKVTDQIFNASDHSIKNYSNYKEFIELIDEKKIYGTNGNLPEREYKAIEIKVNGVKILLPKAAIQNLFEPTIEYTTAFFNEKSQTLYVRADNSDGSGSYAVVWVVEKGKYKQRCIGVAMKFTGVN